MLPVVLAVVARMGLPQAPIHKNTSHNTPVYTLPLPPTVGGLFKWQLYNGFV